MEQTNRKSFVFYRSFRDALNDLPDDMQGRLYKAVADYALDGAEPNFSTGIESAVWKLIKTKLETNRKRYSAACKRN